MPSKIYKKYILRRATWKLHELFNSVIVEQLCCRMTRIKQGKSCMSVILSYYASMITNFGRYGTVMYVECRRADFPNNRSNGTPKVAEEEEGRRIAGGGLSNVK